ncbi:hypothetical protein [Hyalangium versicolor]|uniref:hypothetical protein n=1 Tax=Hyalangium versicolor TaxID=2861190 RepID=UPI001CCB68B9|nr:hypothetical protein [Hyalangium versicolor]
MLLPLALVLSLGAVPPVAPCVGERMVMLPFDAVALPRPEARRTEEAVRRAVTRTAGVCLEPRQETVARLRVHEDRKETCTEDVCRAAEVKSLGAKWLIRGRVLGLGGERTVTLSLVGADGMETRSTFQVTTLDATAEETAQKAFIPLWKERQPRTVEAKARRTWPLVLVGTGAAVLATGVGFGLVARSTAQRFSRGTGGCDGEGEQFRQCFSDGLRRGRRQSHIANGLLGAGAVLGAGGAILFVWELP